MKNFIILFFLFVIPFFSVAQSEMNTNCLARIKENFKNEIYQIFKGNIAVTGNTIKFDSSCIMVDTDNTASLSIFERGLIFPELILTTSTTFTKTHIIYYPGKDTINISGVQEIIFPDQPPHSKTFTFLIWRKKMANPGLYMFQLTSDSSNPGNLKDFIKKANLTAFGFCSILI